MFSVIGQCPLCKRDMIVDNNKKKLSSINEHHLIPKSYKGKDTILIHRICHDKIHTVFSEYELYKYYHTIERILEHKEIKKFVKWVSKKDPQFYSTNRDTNNRRLKRKR